MCYSFAKNATTISQDIRYDVLLLFLLLLKQEAEKTTRGTVTTRGRLVCQVKEDYVWKPGDAL